MTGRPLDCLGDRRRHAVRLRDLNGLDHVEVADDRLELTVYFLGRAPDSLTRDNVRISGGRRIRDVRVTDVRICEQVDPELDNCMVVSVDRPGDFSTYRLSLVNLPDDTPFDPRYRCLDFEFTAACPTELDCAAPRVCPPETRVEPEISYLARDYASFRRLILDRLAVTMPQWTERHVPDLGITLVELLAYVGDHLSYYQDAVATEAYLDTARQRISVRRHARLVDYPMHEGCNARAWLTVWTSADLTRPADELTFLTGVPGLRLPDDRLLTWDDLWQVPSSGYQAFEPLTGHADVEFVEAHNEIDIYTWGDTECCLRTGATSATLVDTGLQLAAGDVLIFEEVLGPVTGDRADADPARRHVVRLTAAERAVDELYDQPVVEVEWALPDALPFPLCISVLGPPPECAVLTGVSVARGNVVLVDHGRSTPPADLGAVPTASTTAHCECEGVPSDVVRVPGPFRPHLPTGPLTFAEPVRPDRSAAERTVQDPRAAAPSLVLTSRDEDGRPRGWSARRDLLAGSPDDAHYVVEVDDDGRARLRFGDGRSARRPEAGDRFEARYRVGNGPAGNVGAEAITLVVTENLVGGVRLWPRNPLPARGGTAAEPVADVKLLAPHAFRHVPARAVTAEDYARLAERHPGVQRAAAELRWNGSWFEAHVAVDPLGSAEPDPALLDAVETFLYPFRRVGHDVAVHPARYVPLDLVFDVCIAPDHLRGHVRAALSERFGAFRSPDGALGFFHPDALTFGTPVASSRLVAAAQAVPGVQSVALTRLERLFEGPNGELEAGVLPIGALEIARLDNDPSFPEHGRIRFDLRGGR